MLATSTTSVVAFLANMMSDLVPVASFGIFVAIVIPVNFLLAVFLLPAEIILWEKYLKKYDKCDWCKVSLS